MKGFYKIALLIIAIIFIGCQEYYPKPRGYYRIDLPEKSYQKTDDNLPVNFEYPTYSKLNTITTKESTNDLWYDVVFGKLNARLHLSYIRVNNNYRKLSEDSRKFVYKHTVKADAINENVFHNSAKNLHGIIYELEGNTASSIQFIATDSTTQFLRGALYFNNRPNADSIAPVLNFIKEDIYHLIETLNWKQ